LEGLPQPDNELGLAVVKIPAPTWIKLDEMGMTAVSQIAPALGDLSRGKSAGPSLAWEASTSSRRTATIIFT